MQSVLSLETRLARESAACIQAQRALGEAQEQIRLQAVGALQEVTSGLDRLGVGGGGGQSFKFTAVQIMMVDAVYIKQEAQNMFFSSDLP